MREIPEYILFPPEASTNWLFNENLMFNLLENGIKIIVDEADIKRYGRLAGRSQLDLMKYFLLTFLNRQGILQPWNYKALYPTPKIDQALKDFDSRDVFRHRKRNASLLIRGYRNYIDYVSVKEAVLDRKEQPADYEKYQEELRSARAQIKEIENDAFSAENYRNYLKRIYTKISASRTICHALAFKGFDTARIHIFDSREYHSGQGLLKNGGIDLDFPFPMFLYYRNRQLQRIKEICEKEQIFPALGQKYISLPMVIIKALSLFGENKIIPTLKQELETVKKKDIVEQVKTLRRHNEKLHHRRPRARRLFHTAKNITSIFRPEVTLFDLAMSSYDFLIKSKSVSAEYLKSAQLISAIIEGEAYFREELEWIEDWYKWVHDIFTSPREADLKWSQSQRTMEGWTSGLYVPWYERPLPSG